MIHIRSGKREALCAGGLALLCCAGLGRLFSLDFVDLRYQAVSSFALSPRILILSFALLFLLFLWELEAMREKFSDEKERIAAFFRADFPLLFWLPAWFFAPDFGGVALLIAAGAWTAGRAAVSMRFPSLELSGRQGAWSIVILSLCFALVGGALQIRSLHQMAMQWLDWGHFFESLTNTLDGRFFHLNLTGGCYLSSRFCLSLLSLLPVAALRSPELFLLTGAFLIASGAVVVYFGARELRFSPSGSLLFGIAFLLLPLTVNLLLPLLDGFHEVFLLLPSVLGCWLCYRKKRWLPAFLLLLFSFGIRETVGFMWAGWGLVLLWRKKWISGGMLLIVSVAILVALLGFVMPALAGGKGYEHTIFFPHLGTSIREIALSPLMRPQAFWGTLFSRHTLLFLVTLLLPFIWGVWRKPLLLVPLLPDLLMVSLDSRFDSQNLLRHYQMVPLIVLVIASLESLAELRDRPPAGRTGKWLQRIFGGQDLFAGACGAMAAGTVLSFWCYTQVPGLPASDPRLGKWSDAGETVAELKRLIPPGVKITAGPRLASHFVCRNDVFLWRGVETEALQDHVVVESFHPMYGENALRKRLLSSPGWTLKETLLLDERMIQLFQRTPGSPAPLSLFLPALPEVAETQWTAWGTPIPSAIPGVSLRGKRENALLLIRARLEAPVSGDIAFSITLRGEKGEATLFRPFGGGAVPAGLAGQGRVCQIAIPLEDFPVSSCQVDLIRQP